MLAFLQRCGERLDSVSPLSLSALCYCRLSWSAGGFFSAHPAIALMTTACMEHQSCSLRRMPSHSMAEYSSDISSRHMLQGSFKVQTPSDGQVIDLATHIMTCSGAQVAFLQLLLCLPNLPTRQCRHKGEEAGKVTHVGIELPFLQHCGGRSDAFCCVLVGALRAAVAERQPLLGAHGCHNNDALHGTPELSQAHACHVLQSLVMMQAAGRCC